VPPCRPSVRAFQRAAEGAEGFFLEEAVSGRAAVLGRGKTGSIGRERELCPLSEINQEIVGSRGCMCVCAGKRFVTDLQFGRKVTARGEPD